MLSKASLSHIKQIEIRLVLLMLFSITNLKHVRFVNNLIIKALFCYVIDVMMHTIASVWYILIK